MLSRQGLEPTLEDFSHNMNLCKPIWEYDGQNSLIVYYVDLWHGQDLDTEQD